MGYILDSNVVIFYASEQYPIEILLKLDAVVDEAFNISVITKIEALGFNSENQQEMQELSLFLSSANIYKLPDDVVDKTVALRKLYRIKTPDAIIAATALINNLTLISHDNHFKKIPGLEVIDPQSL